VLLKPLPFENPDRLVMLYEQSADAKHPYNVVAGGIFQQWQKQSRSFEQMAIWGRSGYNLSGANGQLPEKAEGGKCSWNLFSTLGVQPAYGRPFSATDDSPNANATVILTWSLWERRFGGDPAIVGKDILLDGEAWTVIGIMPAWFSYPDPEIQVWTPIRHETRPAAMDSLNNHQFRVVARLKAGARWLTGSQMSIRSKSVFAANIPALPVQSEAAQVFDPCWTSSWKGTGRHCMCYCRRPVASC